MCASSIKNPPLVCSEGCIFCPPQQLCKYGRLQCVISWLVFRIKNVPEQNGFPGWPEAVDALSGGKDWFRIRKVFLICALFSLCECVCMCMTYMCICAWECRCICHGVCVEVRGQFQVPVIAFHLPCSGLSCFCLPFAGITEMHVDYIHARVCMHMFTHLSMNTFWSRVAYILEMKVCSRGQTRKT